MELQKLNDKYDELEISIAVTDSVTREIMGEEEKGLDRITVLEEEVMGLKVQNNELRNHLNLTIKELNAVIYLLNTKSTVPENTINLI